MRGLAEFGQALGALRFRPLFARLRAGILGKADLDHRVILPGRSSTRRAATVRAAFGA
jgi:hypothetical protein